jgi:hypothetical protein
MNSEPKFEVSRVSIYCMPRRGLGFCGHADIKQGGYNFSYKILHNPKTKETKVSFVSVSPQETDIDKHIETLHPLAEQAIAAYMAKEGK